MSASSTGPFAEPKWNSPLKVSDYLASAPSSMVKGMFFTCVSRLALEKSGKSIGRPHYTAFKDYPTSEWLELLAEGAAAAYPRLPLRAGLFEIGGHVYRTFSESTIGRVVMSVAGRDVHGAIKLVTRAYQAVGASATVELTELEARRAVIAMRNMWEYPDCYQVGVIAGGVRSYGVNPTARVRVHSACDVDIELCW